jgi:hypothetical protein
VAVPNASVPGLAGMPASYIVELRCPLEGERRSRSGGGRVTAP